MTPKTAQRRYKAAAEKLAEIVEREYPIGARGRAVTAHGHDIHAEVIGHGTPWYQPDHVRVRNVHTGATHRLCFDSVEITELPE